MMHIEIQSGVVGSKTVGVYTSFNIFVMTRLSFGLAV